MNTVYAQSAIAQTEDALPQAEGDLGGFGGWLLAAVVVVALVYGSKKLYEKYRK